MDCKERTSELAAQVAKEKASFEESLRRFKEKGKALKSALETAQASASGNIAALKQKHQVRKGQLCFLLRTMIDGDNFI